MVVPQRGRKSSSVVVKTEIQSPYGNLNDFDRRRNKRIPRTMAEGRGQKGALLGLQGTDKKRKKKGGKEPRKGKGENEKSKKGKGTDTGSLGGRKGNGKKGLKV